MEVLGKGANYEIIAAKGVARCTVVNSASVDREEGARCAQQMRDILVTRVLSAQSGFLGLVFDVRKGPEAFGPITRGMIEAIFRAAESNQRKLAVRTGTNAVQRLQFSSLSRECAPTRARLVDSDDDEEKWVTAR